MKKTTITLLVLLSVVNGFSQIHVPPVIAINNSVNLKSSNLPIVIIETNGQEIRATPKITADMGVIDNPTGRNYLTDKFNNYEGKIAIELRGSSSGGYAKRQYRVETRNENGENNNVPLLGMNEDNDWIFYGPYVDESLLRNVIAYGISNKMGRYASATRFCEIVVNGEYQGVYVLLEKIKKDKNRVNIATLDSTDTQGDDLTGGYIIKLDKSSGEDASGWRSQHRLYYQYDYPDDDKMLDVQKTFIQNFINSFETTVDNYNKLGSPVIAYDQYIDTDAFVDHFLINEFAKNVDAFRISAFLYKDKDSKGGKLVAGPIWDFNLSFGLAWFEEDFFLTEGWQLDYNQWRPYDGNVPFWWEVIGHDPYFVNKAMIRWNTLKYTTLGKNSLFNTIDILVDSTEEARIRNFVRWPEREIQPYEDEIQQLKDWINARWDWIDANLASLSNVGEPQAQTTITFNLEQNYPNPFNGGTSIAFTLNSPGQVTLGLYNVNGQLVKTLINEVKNAGYYTVQVKSNDLASGIYMYKLSLNQSTQTRKLLILK